MADGLFYWDSREPFNAADATAVTLAATAKALYPAGAFPVLGGQYFARPGKKLRIRLFGRITTGLTPGNGSFTYTLGSTVHTSAGVFTMDSVLVRTLWSDSLLTAGTHYSYWDGKDDYGTTLVNPDSQR